MFDPELERSVASPSIFLEYGSSVAECDDGSFEICEQGMEWNTRRPLVVDTHYRVSFSCRDGKGDWRHYEAEATVVDCAEICPACYRVTLYFTMAPDELLEVIGDVSTRLEARLMDGRVRHRR